MLRGKKQTSTSETEKEAGPAPATMGNAQQAQIVAAQPAEAPAESALLQAARETEAGPEEASVDGAETAGGGVTSSDPTGDPDPLTPEERATAMLSELDGAAEVAETAGEEFVPSVQQGATAAALIEEATAGMTSEERTAWFAEDGQRLLTHVQESLANAGDSDADQASYEETISSLMRAGEEGGADISGVIAEALMADGPSDRQIAAIVDGIRSGDGAMVAIHTTALAQNRHYLHGVTEAFYETADAYDRARDVRISTEGTFAAHLAADERAAEHPELFDPEVREASRESVLSTVDEARLSEEEAAAIYASTLEGQALAARLGLPGAGYWGTTDGIKHLGETQAGRHAAAASLLRAGQGEDTWVTAAGDGEMSEGVRELIADGTMEGVGLLIAAGSRDDAATLTLGASRVLAGSDPQLAETLELAASQLETARSPEDYSVIIAEAAASTGIQIPSADDLAAMRERGEALDPRADFLQLLGVFAGAGEEWAGRERDGAIPLTESALGTVGNAYDGLSYDAPAGLGAIKGGLQIAGGIDAVLSGSATMRDWVNASLGGGDVANEILGAMGRNTERLGNVLMRSGQLAGGAFAAIDLTTALRDGRDGDAAAAFGQLLTNGAALRMSAQFAKRFMGVAGVAWTAYDVYNYLDTMDTHFERSRDLLSDSAVAALGISPEAADDFAMFANDNNGTALDSFGVMTQALGMTNEELATTALPDDPMLRFLLLDTIRHTPGPEYAGDPDAQRTVERRVSEFQTMVGMPRLPDEDDEAYYIRLTDAARESWR